MKALNLKLTLFIRIFTAASIVFAYGSVLAGTAEWSGFLSVTGGKALGSNHQFLAEAQGPGIYTDRLVFTPESLLGLQVDFDISDKLHAAVQAIGKSSQNYNVNLNLAEVSYALNNQMKISGGLFQLPVYYYSDYANIKYAYHWLRAPMELYTGDNNSVTGAKFSYNKMLGDVNIQAQIISASTRTKIQQFSATAGTNVYADYTVNGINVSFSLDWFEARVLYQKFKMNIETDALVLLNDNPIDYWGIATKLDWNWLFAIGEVTGYESEKTINDILRWYGSVGCRIDKLTLHTTYGKSEEDDNNTKSAVTKYNTFSVGLRFDFLPNAAFKLDYSKRKDESEGTAFYYGDSEIITSGVDVVF